MPVLMLIRITGQGFRLPGGEVYVFEKLRHIEAERGRALCHWKP